MSQPQLSVVVPVFNERDNVPPLIDEITAALRGRIDFVIVYVDDHSRDDTLAVLQGLKVDNPELRVLHHVSQSGQSTAVRTGVKHARAPWIATLDGDGQNPPDNLPALLAPLLSANAPRRLGLVAGQRVGRRDTLGKRLSSRFANGLRARILKDGTRDTGCGLKAFRRDAYLALPYFDHHHRYFPALFNRDGWQVAHVDVTHRARLHGNSHYTNIGRALVGIHDLIGVAWLLRRRKRASWAETFKTETLP